MTHLDITKFYNYNYFITFEYYSFYLLLYFKTINLLIHDTLKNQLILKLNKYAKSIMSCFINQSWNTGRFV
jgi:hypothetical protein